MLVCRPLRNDDVIVGEAMVLQRRALASAAR